MSSITWTPRAVETETRPAELSLWRAVEAQHVIATRALVDSQSEQELLETLLDEAKPAIPAVCASLHYLLFTPFRYPSTRYGSRFRAFTDAGAWYGAEELGTACAEVGYWRWKFVKDSHGLTRLDGVAHTLFQATAAGTAVDTREKPFTRDKARWMDAGDYSACQTFARIVREAETQIIRYASVRNPEPGSCAAILDCRCFVGHGGVRRQQTWFLTVDARHASWVRASGGARRADETFEFSFA